jgi:uncharacterized membrane protein
MVVLVAAPSRAARDSGAGAIAAAMVYAAGSTICHQRPERSFHQDGAQLPVCARCTGLYAGAMSGVLGWAAASGLRRRPRPLAAPFTRPHTVRAVLMVAALPTMLSLVTAWIGWWEPENATRAVLGLPLGAVIAACVTAVGAGDMR